MGLDLDEIRLRFIRSTPGEWQPGWWSGQAESHCDCAARGDLVAKTPGAGPFHHHTEDFFPDDHTITAGPGGPTVAGMYDVDCGGLVAAADRDWIIACRTDVPALVAEVEKHRAVLLRLAAEIPDAAIRVVARIVAEEMGEPAAVGA